MTDKPFQISLRLHGCFLKRAGGSHSIWLNPATGVQETIRRQTQIPNVLARKSCRGLSIPEIGRRGL